jgi:hypothetical protein
MASGVMSSKASAEFFSMSQAARRLGDDGEGLQRDVSACRRGRST